MDILKVFILEQERFQLTGELDEAKQRYRQAQYQNRQCSAQYLEYSHFSLATVRDRLRGQYDQILEQHRRAARDAEMELVQARQELERVQLRQKINQQELEALPAWESLPQMLDPESAELQEYRSCEVKLCRLMLKPALNTAKQALLESQRVYRGDTMGQIMTPQERQEALAAYRLPAQKCAALLRRWRAVQEDAPELTDYFQNPAGFIESATKYSKFDRFAEALKQVSHLEQQVQ